MSLRSMVRAVRRRFRDEPRLRRAAMQADAFLISYPKSGRTWLRYLLSCYFADVGALGFEPDLKTTFRVLPNFDLDRVRGIANSNVGEGRSRIPTILVSHLQYRQRLFLDRPVIFLVRDPRDVIVSAYFHATRHKKVFHGDMAAFLDDPTYGPPALLRFLNGWAEGLHGRRHLLVSYERMQADPHGTVASILAFLGVEVDETALDRAVAAAQFDRMRDKEQAQGIPGHDYDRSDALSLRMRSGRAGGFSDWLTDDQADRVMQMCRAGLTPLGQELLNATGVDFHQTPRAEPAFRRAV